MIKDQSMKLDKRFFKVVRGRFDRHEFQVGILKDERHKKARPASAGTKSLAGGPARKTTSKRQKVTLAQLSGYLRNRLGVNFYRQPFRSKKNKEIVRFANYFLKAIMNNGVLREKKRMENLLQAIVRNPIARGDYGVNTGATAKRKGFNRLLIDTGQLFNGIKAKITVRSGE